MSPEERFENNKAKNFKASPEQDNVIHPDFEKNGYIMDEDKKSVEGVYNGNLCAMKQDGMIFIGQKADGGIDNSVEITEKQMNEFCLKWLLIFDPDVIKE